MIVYQKELMKPSVIGIYPSIETYILFTLRMRSRNYRSFSPFF